MQVPLVMTIIGADRPGLVDLVSGIVAEHGGNWLESRMCHLGGEFAGILRVTVEDSREAALADALKKLEAKGVTVVVRSDRAPAVATGKSLAALEVMGQDRPGIVRQISHALAQRGVNVEELSTECGSAAMSGEMLFKAIARLRIPESVAVEDLRRDLEKIAEDLVVDITLAPVRSEPAKQI